MHGEVRMKLDKPETIASIDAWVCYQLNFNKKCYSLEQKLVVKSTSVLDIAGDRLVNQHVILWAPERGDPRSSSLDENLQSFKGKFPAGTFIFVSDEDHRNRT